MTDDELLMKAASIVKSRRIGDSLIGDVGCALVTDRNNVYLGVCASIGSNSFCAEKAAIGAMITNGEFRISRIVAVWKNEAGEIFVLAPCGTCRQLIYEFDKENLDTDVIMGKNRTMKLKELLPYEKHFSKI